LFGPASEQGRVAVVSLGIEGTDPQDVAAILDQSFGIETRAGLHCAPGAHRAIGSFDAGGTVRLSVGPFTTSDDVAAAIDALRQIAGAS
jgi:selenocysteine lyase/cysteine desulfurase